MMRSVLILAVDGGGTSTIAWLANGAGEILGKGASGPSNIKAVGPNASMTALDLSILSAFRDANIEPGPVTVSCFGLAGFDRPEDKAWLKEWADEAVWASQFIFVNDGDIVVAAGTPEGFGVGIIAGTGSIAVGKNREGQTARAGGWGYLFGDEGSGYAVAVEGLKRVARMADGREKSMFESDPLTKHMCEALEIPNPSGLVNAVYGNGFNRARISALANAVVKAAEEDPSIISEILVPAGCELAKAVRAVALKLGWESGPLDLAVAGSFLLMTPFVWRAMIEELTRSEYEVKSQLVEHPVRGAIAIARKAIGL